MPMVESSYVFVLDRFGEDVVEDRFGTIYGLLSHYLEANGLSGDVAIQEDLLSYAIMDYFVDLMRLKDFEGIEFANLNKIVCYECHWLLRRKPLQPVAAEGASDEAIFANEGFCAWYMAHALLDECLGEAVPGELPPEYFEFFDHLYYHLKYRPVEPKSLELAMSAFQAGAAVRAVGSDGGGVDG